MMKWNALLLVASCCVILAMVDGGTSTTTVAPGGDTCVPPGGQLELGNSTETFGNDTSEEDFENETAGEEDEPTPDQVADGIQEILKDPRFMSTAVGRKKRSVDGWNTWLTYGPGQMLATWRCCPRTQWYGCRSNVRKIPCYRHYIRGRFYNCCPVWSPQSLYIAFCNCHKCAVMSPYCISTGTCHRRFSSRQYMSVCYPRYGGRPIVDWHYRSVPTSCYCKACGC